MADAIGSGGRAAEGILAMFRGEPPVNGRDGERITSESLNLFYFPTIPRTVPRTLGPVDLAARTFDEVVAGLDWAGARAEAVRCVRCGECTHCDVCVTVCPNHAVARDEAGGGYAVDLDRCKGCGTCAAECPPGALKLSPDSLR